MYRVCCLVTINQCLIVQTSKRLWQNVILLTLKNARWDFVDTFVMLHDGNWSFFPDWLLLLNSFTLGTLGSTEVLLMVLMRLVWVCVSAQWSFVPPAKMCRSGAGSDSVECPACPRTGTHIHKDTSRLITRTLQQDAGFPKNTSKQAETMECFVGIFFFPACVLPERIFLNVCVSERFLLHLQQSSENPPLCSLSAPLLVGWGNPLTSWGCVPLHIPLLSLRNVLLLDSRNSSPIWC